MEHNWTVEDFTIIGTSKDGSEKIASKPVTYLSDAWRRFRQNKVALVALGILVFITLMTIFQPMFSRYEMAKFDALHTNEWPSLNHLFGTDQLGRDLFVRVWEGGRVSIVIGIAGAAIVAVVGCIYGGLSAYFGGSIDALMMRIVDILSSVPHLLVVLMMSIILDSKSIPTLLLAMTITGWCPVARIVRAQMLQVSQSDYVAAAKLIGVPPLKIVVQHLIPNTLSVIIVDATFRSPGFIFSEAFLSYVGLGVAAPNTSWGALASAAQLQLLYYPYQLLFPTLMIALTMLSFTLIGDGLRDALDPKLRR